MGTLGWAGDPYDPYGDACSGGYCGACGNPCEGEVLGAYDGQPGPDVFCVGAYGEGASGEDAGAVPGFAQGLSLAAGVVPPILAARDHPQRGHRSTFGSGRYRPHCRQFITLSFNHTPHLWKHEWATADSIQKYRSGSTPQHHILRRLCWIGYASVNWCGRRAGKGM